MGLTFFRRFVQHCYSSIWFWQSAQSLRRRDWAQVIFKHSAGEVHLLLRVVYFIWTVCRRKYMQHSMKFGPKLGSYDHFTEGLTYSQSFIFWSLFSIMLFLPSGQRGIFPYSPPSPSFLLYLEYTRFGGKDSSVTGQLNLAILLSEFLLLNYCR